jgi:hypothetical protein
MTTNYTIYTIIHSIASSYALYLSFEMNGGFSFGSFLVALFAPYLYIIYYIGVEGSIPIPDIKFKLSATAA